MDLISELTSEEHAPINLWKHGLGLWRTLRSLEFGSFFSGYENGPNTLQLEKWVMVFPGFEHEVTWDPSEDEYRNPAFFESGKGFLLVWIALPTRPNEAQRQYAIQINNENLKKVADRIKEHARAWEVLDLCS